MLDADGWGDHRAGQHLDVRLTAEDGYQAERSYSIASAPGEPLAITVERLEDGEVSPYLVDEVRDGDGFEVRGPIGGYFVWDGDEPEPVLLVAGGSGVVPLAAMARQRARLGSAAPMRLLYSSRTLGRRDLPRRARDARGRGRVHADARAAARLEGLRAADRRRAAARGRVPGVARRPRVYVCGSTRFVDAAADGLVRLGYDPSGSGPSASERRDDGAADLDGNAIGGLLLELFGTELTAAPCVCGGCGAREEMARLDVYVDCPGVVVRCRHCTDVMITIVRSAGPHLGRPGRNSRPRAVGFRACDDDSNERSSGC